MTTTNTRDTSALEAALAGTDLDEIVGSFGYSSESYALRRLRRAADTANLDPAEAPEWMRYRRTVENHEWTLPPSNSGVTHLTDRLFGVEIECVIPDHGGRNASLDALFAHLTDADGFGIRDCRNLAHTEHITEDRWLMKYDVTPGPSETQRRRGIAYGVEIAMGRGMSGAEAVRQTRAICKALRDFGAVVNRTCGVHVHHDMNGETGETIARVVEMYAAHQEQINCLVAPSRRGPGQYIGPFADWEVERIADAARFHGDTIRREGSSLGNVIRYRNLNVGDAYARHGTIEFRQHQGSLNADKIIAWAALGQAMIEAAREGRTIDTADPIAMISALNIGDEAEAFLRDRIGELA